MEIIRIPKYFLKRIQISEYRVALSLTALKYVTLADDLGYYLTIRFRFRGAMRLLRPLLLSTDALEHGNSHSRREKSTCTLRIRAPQWLPESPQAAWSVATIFEGVLEGEENQSLSGWN